MEKELKITEMDNIDLGNEAEIAKEIIMDQFISSYQYLITTNTESPFFTNWFDPDNHFNEGMIVYDLHNGDARCKYGQSPCPIALIQMTYNYDQHKDKTGTATKIMDTLVSNDGSCQVFEMAKNEFEVDPNQMSLF